MGLFANILVWLGVAAISTVVILYILYFLVMRNVGN